MMEKQTEPDRWYGFEATVRRLGATPAQVRRYLTEYAAVLSPMCAITPAGEPVLSDKAVVLLHGLHVMHQGGFSTQEVEGWATRMRCFASKPEGVIWSHEKPRIERPASRVGNLQDSLGLDDHRRNRARKRLELQPEVTLQERAELFRRISSPSRRVRNVRPTLTPDQSRFFPQTVRWFLGVTVVVFAFVLIYFYLSSIDTIVQ